MYIPAKYGEDRISVMHGLIASHPLGMVVTHGPDGLSADHIPFEVSAPTGDAPFGILRAHVARANPLWRRDGVQVLAAFQGATRYVSPSEFEEKALTGRVVPTWDYAVVHAHGTLRAVDDPVWLAALLERLTRRHEAGQAAPWAVSDAPRDYIDKLMAAIVGIEIRIERMEGKWKIKPARLTP